LEKANFKGQLRDAIDIAVHYPPRRTGEVKLMQNGKASPNVRDFGLVIRTAAALNSDLGAMPRYPQRAFQEQ
jgi:hypothetical protein